MNAKEHYDFSCYVIKYGRVSICGKTYQTDSLIHNDGIKVPLYWNHQHFDTNPIFGHARLEARGDGIYAYCTLYEHPDIEAIKQLLRDRGSVSLSPYVTRVKTDGAFITGGTISEVSLVFARVDPDEAYYPVMKQDDK